MYKRQGTPHPNTKPARIFGVSLAKCSILATVVLAVFISWNRYTAAVTPTETTGASVGSAGLSYGCLLYTSRDAARCGRWAALAVLWPLPC